MANEVQIVVKSSDKTDFGGISKHAKHEFDKAGRDSGDGFQRGFSGSITRAATTFFGGIAENASGIFSKQFGTAASSNPYLGAGIAAAFAGVIAVVLPAIGSLAAGAFVAAFGAGLAGLGIYFAAQSAKVQAAWKTTIDDVKKQLTEISKPFEPVLVNISKMFRRTFQAFLPFLEDAFKKMAPAVEPFADALSQAFVELAPVIGPVTDAFIAILDAIKPSLAPIMQQLADAITEVAESISDNPQTFANLVTWIIQAGIWTIRLIAWLSRLANWFQEHPNITKGLAGALMGVVGPIGTLIELFRRTKAAWDAVKNFRASISAGTERFQTAVAGAVARGLGFARRIFTAALNGQHGPLARSLAQAVSRGAAFARRIFTAAAGIRINGVLDGIRRAISAGLDWARRVFTATLRVRMPDLPHLPGFASGGISHAAEGGPRSNLALVGERGRELVRLPFGSSVVPNGQTEAMLAGGGGGQGPIHITLQLGGQNLAELLIDPLRKTIRTLGGDVQAALGR